MKSVLFGMMLVFSLNAVAANAPNSCDIYIQAAQGNATPKVRLELGLKAAASVAGLKLTPGQESNILSRVSGFIAKNPKKQDDFEKMFYFACTADLDADEKEQIQEQFSAFENL